MSTDLAPLAITVGTMPGGTEHPEPANAARDLAALLALPAIWLEREPAAIASDLPAILVSMLRLQSAYVRFDGVGHDARLESWLPDGLRPPAEFGPALAATNPREGERDPASLENAFRVARVIPAIPGEGGLVLAGSERPDFPTAAELHLLRAAVGQATIAIATARRFTNERAARQAAERALRARNTFLAELARDLTEPLDLLAERVAQARRLAAETEPLESVVIPHAVETPSRLTRRETEVLGLLAQGLSNKEIAAVLSLSDRTVERHITGVYRKIGVERRSEATAFALRHGFADDERT